jgi:hypothetical protein
MPMGGKAGDGAPRMPVIADGSAVRVERVTPIGAEGRVVRGYPTDPVTAHGSEKSLTRKGGHSADAKRVT